MGIKNRSMNLEARTRFSATIGSFNFNANPAATIALPRACRLIALHFFNATSGALTAASGHTVLIGTTSNTNAYKSSDITGQIVPAQDQTTDPPATSNVLSVPINIDMKVPQQILISQSGMGSSPASAVFVVLEYEVLDKQLKTF